MAEIKGILADVDGTMLQANATLPAPGVINAARCCSAPIFPVTGRSLERMNLPMRLLDLRGLGVLDSGASIIDCGSSEYVYTDWLAPDTVERVAHSIGSMCNSISPFSELQMINPRSLPEISFTRKSPAVLAIVHEHYRESVNGILNDIPGTRAVVVDHDRQRGLKSFRVTNDTVSKKHAAQDMLSRLGLTGEPLMAIGDSASDKDLFDLVSTNGIKVAMGSAPEQLKDLADYVAPAASEHGFAVALRHFRLVPQEA